MAESVPAMVRYPYTGPAMTRPVPVVLSAVLLGFFAAFQLLSAAAMVVIGIVILHKGLPGMAATPAPLPPALLPVLFFGIAIFYIAIAVWFILTLVGLMRLRSWARYSLLVIAGLMTAFAGMGALVSIAVPVLMSHSTISAPGLDTSAMHKTIFLFIGALYAIFTVIGIAQLIYFNRARTRTIFQQRMTPSYAALTTSTGKRRPMAISVISWFLLIGGPLCCLYALFPLPAFIFGFTLVGIAGRIVYLTMGALSFFIGLGLYQLRSEARTALIAWLGLGFINSAAIFTPWGMRNFRAYMERFSVHNPAFDMSSIFSSPVILLPSLIIGAGFSIFILWLLRRHRDAFTQASPPPPSAINPTPYDGMTS
jgi:hypothetical protein